MTWRNSIDIYTSAGYMLRVDCWKAEKNLKTTPGSDCALNAKAPNTTNKIITKRKKRFWQCQHDNDECKV